MALEKLHPLLPHRAKKRWPMATGCPAVLFTSGLMDFSFSARGDFSNNSCSSSKKHDRVQLKGAQPFRGQLETLALLQSLASSNRIQLRTCPHNMKVQYSEVLHPWTLGANRWFQVRPATLRLNPGNVQKCCCMSLCRAPNG